MPRSITVRTKPQPRLKVLFTEVDFGEDAIDLDSEPSAAIGRKAEAVAELLGCSYEQAERLVIGFTE